MFVIAVMTMFVIVNMFLVLKKYFHRDRDLDFVFVNVRERDPDTIFFAIAIGLLSLP